MNLDIYSNLTTEQIKAVRVLRLAGCSPQMAVSVVLAQ